MPDYVEIRGLDELTRRLDSFKDLKKVIPALEASARHIEGVVKEYAPETAANKEGGPGSRWYQRGFGPKWKVKSGEIHGRKTSETLGRKWTVQSKNHGLTQIIGNNVSYAKYVHGEEQAHFHADRGWKTIFDVVKQESDTVLNFVKDRVDKILSGVI